MAAGAGFEPTKPESESGGLPLTYPAIWLGMKVPPLLTRGQSAVHCFYANPQYRELLTLFLIRS